MGSVEVEERSGSRWACAMNDDRVLNKQDNIEAWVNVAGSLLGTSRMQYRDIIWLTLRRLKSHDGVPVWRDARYSRAGKVFTFKSGTRS